MNLTKAIKIFSICLMLGAVVSCKDDFKPGTEETVAPVTFSLSVDKVSLETADLRIRHDGSQNLKWVYIQTADLDTDADQLIDAAVAKELEFSNEILANSGNNRSVRLSGLLPKTYYRLVVKALDNFGNPYGKAASLLFRTQRNLDVFEENMNWNITYDGRTEGILPGSMETIEFDNFKCTSTDDEPYLIALIKDSDYKAYQKDPDHKLKIRTFFEDYIASTGIESSEWAEVLEKGDCIWKEQRLRHGDWIVFMVGVDEEGELTGLYRQVATVIEEEIPTDEFNKWLGTWDVTGYDQGVRYDFRLSILSSEANMWYYSIGWEPNNIYAFDPAFLPVEIFFDKITGNAYLVSQYVTSAVDEIGNQRDFYFYGTFQFGDSSTFVDIDNMKVAEIKMTNAANTEARVTGLTFNTTQAGSQLSFQFSEVIYYMTDGVNGTAISMSHPDFPFTMKKVLE